MSINIPEGASATTPALSDPSQRPPRVWKFWGTSLWGLFIFAAMFAGQLTVVAYFMLAREGALDFTALKGALGGGLTISVIMGLPAVLGAIWLATRMARTSFADYLALRWTPWTNVLIGAVALFV